MRRINIALAVATLVILGFVVYQRFGPGPQSVTVLAASTNADSRTNPIARLAASGWIEGRTANVKLGSRISEQIERILVNEGEWVNAGEILLRLDSTLFSLQQGLAEAELSRAQAELNRIENGFRSSEIDEVRNECLAFEAELEGARKNVARIEQLIHNFAASQQAYDEEFTRARTLEKKVAASRSRLATFTGPPRKDELETALAGVLAARSRLALAQENLRRTQVIAPLDGRVLRINCEVGELANPDDPQPLIVLADTRALRAVAEVDEFDALRVEVGQRAVITTNQSPKIHVRGLVAEIEPQLDRKRSYSSRPGERLDAFSRRVWIALESTLELPVGLPVDVLIATEPQPVEEKLIRQQLGAKKSSSAL